MGFSDDIAKFVQHANGNGHKLVRKVVLDIGTRLVERTPVGDADYWQSPPPPGYVGGHARANWSHSMGSQVITEFDEIDKTGKASLSRIAATVPNFAAGLVHYIQNSVPYIQALEDGHSRQAPHGMVAVTEMEFQATVKKALGGTK